MWNEYVISDYIVLLVYKFELNFGLFELWNSWNVFKGRGMRWCIKAYQRKLIPFDHASNRISDRQFLIMYRKIWWNQAWNVQSKDYGGF